MKVSDSPNEITEGFKSKIDLWKMQFTNHEIESNYLRSLPARIKEPVIKYKYESSKALHCIILIIYGISYILEVLNSSSHSESSLKFQMILITLCLIIVLFLSSTHFKCLEFPLSAGRLDLSCYLLSGIILILNDNYFQRVTFADSPLPYLSSLHGLLAISVLYSSRGLGNYISWIYCSLFIAVLYALFRFLTNSQVFYGILEVLLLLTVQSYQIISIYHSNYCERTKYSENLNANSSSETEKLIVPGEANSGYDLKLQECIVELRSMAPTLKEGFRTSIDKTIGVLTQVLFDNRSRLISEQGNLESLIKDLDEQDQTYLRESWSTIGIQQVRKRAKAKQKVHIDKNLEKLMDAKITLMLKQVGLHWSFNSFELNELSSGSALTVIGKHCFKIYEIFETFSVLESKAENFFDNLQKRYMPNPYHNSCHAADILVSTLFIMHKSIIFESLTDIEVLSIIISHLAHDVGHPGFTNRFLINIQDRLSIECNFYIDNDISVLENMHCSTTFTILLEESSNILGNLELDQFLVVRKWIIELILATDMGKHFEMLGIFRGKYYSAKSLEVPECKLDILKMLIKAADVGHAAKATDLHQMWSLLICEEFFHQGDIEKENGRPISMYCDRDTTQIPKSQTGFLKNIALPLYETLNEFLNSEIVETHCVKQIKINIMFWESHLILKNHSSLKDNFNEYLNSHRPPSIFLTFKSNSDSTAKMKDV